MYYQTSSKEFIEFLRDENVTDHWGDSLYSWWSANGKSTPELMRADSATVTAPNLVLNLKVFLEGAYVSPDSMSVSPAFTAAVPTSQPFSDPMFNGTPLEHDTTLSVSSWQSDYVNWVLVSLRTGTTLESEVFSTPAIIKDDGAVVDTSGSALLIPEISAGSYYVVVRERNHLPAMSASAVDMSSGAGGWNFTTGLSSGFSNTGPAMKLLPDGRTAMIAGDQSLDGQITVADFNLWLVETKAVATGYVQSDLNFDAQSTVGDFNLWLANTKAALSSQVPD